VAALTWREGTCAEAALCPATGRVTTLPPDLDDETAARALAEAIIHTEELDPAHVQKVGQQRFDPQRHFEALASRSC
jgi:hypothetical protein